MEIQADVRCDREAAGPTFNRLTEAIILDAEKEL